MAKVNDMNQREKELEMKKAVKSKLAMCVLVVVVVDWHACSKDMKVGCLGVTWILGM